MGLKRDGGSALNKTKAKSIANLQYHQTCEIVPRSCFLSNSPFKVLDDVYLHPAFHTTTALYQNTHTSLQRRRPNKCLLLIILLGLQLTLSKGM